MLAGISGSVAELVTVKVVSSLIVCVGGDVKVGALFTSLTMTVKLLVSLSGGLPLSVTRRVMTLVLGPCASVGVQVRTPVAGLRLTPVGAATSEKVSVFVGMSGSVAVLVTVRLESSLMVCVDGVVSTGGRFTSFTITVIVFAPLSGGTPLAGTPVGGEFELGP